MGWGGGWGLGVGLKVATLYLHVGFPGYYHSHFAERLRPSHTLSNLPEPCGVTLWQELCPAHLVVYPCSLLPASSSTSCQVFQESCLAGQRCWILSGKGRQRMKK